MKKAEEFLKLIANNKDFQVTDYDLKLSSGSFASEKTEIYSYYRHILDSWKVELVSSDCFPLGINFIGDL